MNKIKFIVFIIFLSVYGNVIKAENNIAIKKYLNKKNIEKATTQIYLLNRCSAVYAYASAVILKSDTKNSKKCIDVANSLLFKSVELRIIDSEEKFEDAKKKAEKERKNLFKKYVEDGEKNWKKNKSYFKGSYITEDMTFCEKLIDSK